MKALLWVVGVIVLMQCVFAVTSERIELSDCGFVVDGNFSCGQSAVITCDVVDLTAADYGVTMVNFVVNGQTYAASLNTGTPKNGTWALVVPITADVGDSVELTSVYAINSEGSECKEFLPSDDFCVLRWNANDREIAVDCVCEWTVIEECNVDNSAVVTHTPGVGCSGEVEYETLSYCDYCDPGWVASYGDCTPTDPDVDPFSGSAVKEYAETDPGCCLETGLQSDCVPPVDDGIEVACQLDAWSGDGKNTFNSKTNQRQGQMDEDIVEVSKGFTVAKVPAVASGLQGQRALKPIVFDFDVDGETESVYFTNTGFTMYDATFNIETTTSSGGVLWQGQPGLFGFNELYSSTGYAWIWEGGNISATDFGFAGIIRNASGKDHFVVFEYGVGGWTLTQNINLWTADSTYAPGAGVSCYASYCYFATQDQEMWRVNKDTGSWNKQALWSSGAHVNTDPLDTVPVFVQTSADGLVSGVAVETWRSSGSTGPGVSLCDLSLSSCDGFLVGPSFNASISRLVAGRYDASAGGSPVYFVLVDNSIAPDPAESYLVYRLATGVSPSWTGLTGYKRMEGTGSSEALCVTDPALSSRCQYGGEEGVVVAPHFEKASVFDGPEYVTYVNLTAGDPQYYSVNADGTLLAATRLINHGTGHFGWYLDLYNLEDQQFIGTVTLQYTDTVSGQAIGYPLFDDRHHKVYVSSRYNTYTSTSYRMLVGDYEVLSAPVLNGSIGLPSIAMSYTLIGDDYIAVLVGSGTERIFMIDSGTVSGEGTVNNSPWYSEEDFLMGYDSILDTLVTDHQFYVNFVENFEDDIAAERYTHAREFNVWNQLSGDDIQGLAQSSDRKIVTSSFPSSTYTTSLACLDFDPLYYGAESYIFGVKASTREFAFCDFSNELSPQVETYDLEYEGAMEATSYTPPVSSPYYSYDTSRTLGYVPTVNYTLNIAYVYSFDASQVSSSATDKYTYYSCWEAVYGGSSLDAFEEKKHLTVPEDICPVSIVTVDTNADTVEEVASVSGLYKWGAGRVLDFNVSQQSYAQVISADLNADTYVDFSLVSAQLKHILSNPDIAVGKASEGSGTSVSSCFASFNAITGKVEVIPGRVSAENPQWLRYDAVLMSSSDSIVDSVSGPNPRIELRPLIGGQYEVWYTVTDELKAIQGPLYPCTTNCPDAMAICNVTVPVDVGVPEFGMGCSLEPDGEFNYPDITSTDWLLGTSSYVPAMVSNQFTRMTSYVEMLHELSCDDEGLSVEVRLRGDASSDTSVTIEAESTLNGIAYQVGGLRLYGGTVQAYGIDGSADVVALAPESIGEWIVVVLSFDFENKEYTVSVDEVEYLTLPFANDVGGAVTGVHVKHDDGTTDVDYIRTAGLTGFERDTRSYDDQLQAYANQALDACINISDRNFTKNPPGDYAVYPHVTNYCNRLHDEDEEQYCGELDLVSAVRYNPTCYWELNNYCQYVTFPSTGGMTDSQVSLKGGPSMTGMMACSTLLATGATWSIIAEPSVNVVWRIVTSNLMILLLIVLVIVIAIPIIMRRKQ